MSISRPTIASLSAIQRNQLQRTCLPSAALPSLDTEYHHCYATSSARVPLTRRRTTAPPCPAFLRLLARTAPSPPRSA